jgi:hypothetical protein
MDEMNELRKPEFIAEAIEINRLRELEFRSKDIGVGISRSDKMDLDAIAKTLSSLIDEVNNG